MPQLSQSSAGAVMSMHVAGQDSNCLVTKVPTTPGAATHLMHANWAQKAPFSDLTHGIIWAVAPSEQLRRDTSPAPSTCLYKSFIYGAWPWCRLQSTALQEGRALIRVRLGHKWVRVGATTRRAGARTHDDILQFDSQHRQGRHVGSTFSGQANL